MNRSHSISYRRACARGVVDYGLGALCLMLVICGARVCLARAAQGAPVAGFDATPELSLRADPLVSGTVAGLAAPLTLTITSAAGSSVYASGPIEPAQGHWSLRVFPPLPAGAYLMTLRSGGAALATSSLFVGLKSLPEISLDDSLPPADVADGRLMRFAVRAGAGPIGIDQLSFSIVPQAASVDALQLYAYTDSRYTEGVGSSTALLNASSTPFESPSIIIVPDTTVEIPAHQTYYFELDGTVTPTDVEYSVETTLLGDKPPVAVGSAATLASSSNMLWSPNTFGTSSPTDTDWLSSALVMGVPPEGLSQMRFSTAPQQPEPLPTCSLALSTTTAKAGVSFVVSWQSSSASSAEWGNGMSAALSGSQTGTTSMTTNFSMLFFNQYGETTCTASLYVPPAAPTDGFAASPISGAVSLAVTFTGSVNNSKSCAAQTYTLGYGDNASSTISVPKNLCAAQAFNFLHTYTKTGSFVAGLWQGAGTSSAQLIQKQTITVTAKTGFLFNTASMMASVWEAFMSLFLKP
jgi:hypothetical protein